MVLPYFDYGSLLWSTASYSNLKIINQLHKRAARIILSPRKFTPTKSLFKTLGWQALADRAHYHRGVFVFKAVNNLLPSYLNNKFVVNITSHGTRSNSNNHLKVPRPKLEVFKRSFVYSGSVLWNSLPSHLKKCKSVMSFKKLFYSYMHNH